MKAVFDNNVIIDALEPRPPYDAAAKELLKSVMTSQIDGNVTANSLTDIFYVLSRKAGEKSAKAAVGNVMDLLGVIDVRKTDCKAALALPNDDFEDALVEVCAEKINADYIISRDEKFAKAATKAQLIKPDELLARIAND